MSSMAVSIASALSVSPSEMDARRFEETANEIVSVLKRDEIPPYDVKRVFAVIMNQFYSQRYFATHFPTVRQPHPILS